MLDKHLEPIAKKELREDEYTRNEALRQMREWLKQNTDVEHVREDDLFLLRFLRNKKFSVHMAQQTLLKYLNFRRVLSNFFTDLDFLSPRINQLLNNGFMFPSPVRDKKGRRVLISQAKYFDTEKFSGEDLVKIHMIAYETLMENETDQIMGFVHVGDFQTVGSSFISKFDPTEFMRILKWGESSVPMRHKEIHVYNVNPTVKFIIDAAKSVWSQKMKERINLYTSFGNFSKNFDTSVLPQELGGTIPMAQMIEMWKQELSLHRESILRLDKMNLLSTRGITSNRHRDHNGNHREMEQGMSGSFRKLEID
jgi:pyridoxine/pyridoxamine 5'-phosphate oxidase